MDTAGVWVSDDVLEAYFKELQDVFHGQGSKEIPDFFAFPLVIYTPVGVTLVQNTRQFQSIVSAYREALGSRGVVKTELLVEGQAALSDQRLQATVRYTDLGEDGHVIASTVAKYFLMRHGDRYKIEMLEYLELPLSLSEVERIVH
ncbi:MAG: hypothetical protein AAF230_03565 [Pseudomonadota bacterium]